MAKHVKETIKECLDAEKVVSVSSSIIYEIMGLGVDVEILGKGKGVFPALREWDDLNHCLKKTLSAMVWHRHINLVSLES